MKSSAKNQTVLQTWVLSLLSTECGYRRWSLP